MDRRMSQMHIIILLSCLLGINTLGLVFLFYEKYKHKKRSVYERLLSCTRQVRKKIDFVPEIALILGSGLGDFAKEIHVLGEIHYKNIKGFPVSTAPGHEGKFVYGTLHGKNVICMKGRIHYYEGYSMEDVVLPIRLMHNLGANTLILTNAVGGLNSSFSVGDFMMLKNHISLFIRNPLIGPNEAKLGERFPDMSEPYDPKLQNIIRKAAQKLGLELKEGVFAQLTGPSYESSAEIKMLRQIGVDAVGMSVVTECIAARHCGMKVCGISCITNMSYDLSSQIPNEQEVIEAGKQSAEKFSKLIKQVIADL